MQEYLLILRDHEQRWDNFSPEDFQRIIGKYAEWNAQLAKEERFVGAGKLTSDLGGTVRRGDDGFVVDGPFTESKEAIAGYYQIRASSLEAAYAVAGQCPILDYGGSVEVREMATATAPRACT